MHPWCFNPTLPASIEPCNLPASHCSSLRLFHSSSAAFWRCLCLSSSPLGSKQFGILEWQYLRWFTGKNTLKMKETHGTTKILEESRRVQLWSSQWLSGNLGPVWFHSHSEGRLVTISCPSPLAQLVATSLFQVTYVKPKTSRFCIDLCRKAYKHTRWTTNLDWGTGYDSPELSVP